MVDLEAGLADVTRLELRTFGPGDPVAMSALVTADEGGEEQRFLLAPAGGGSVLTGGVQVLTTSSPLGRALLGKRVDEEVELKLPGKTRSLVISAIS